MPNSLQDLLNSLKSKNTTLPLYFSVAIYSFRKPKSGWLQWTPSSCLNNWFWTSAFVISEAVGLCLYKPVLPSSPEVKPGWAGVQGQCRLHWDQDQPKLSSKILWRGKRRKGGRKRKKKNQEKQIDILKPAATFWHFISS